MRDQRYEHSKDPTRSFHCSLTIQLRDYDGRLLPVDYTKIDRPWRLFALKTLNAHSKIYPGKAIKNDIIDWNQLRAWLVTCSKVHYAKQFAGITCGEPIAISQIRVIDIEMACVRLLPNGVGYIALSYQWGASQKLKLQLQNFSLLCTPGYFDTCEVQPARTILDAMVVTRQLGGRYLWVDALCIIQDDMNDLENQVGVMSHIYRDAELTIVAAAGESADHGLCGVSVSRDVQQTIAVVKGITLAHMLEDMSTIGSIASSRWNTRGWTYQERVLSPRLITFTRSQVFFHCDGLCSFAEEFQPLGPSFWTSVPDPLSYFRVDTDGVWASYSKAVDEYSRRTLSDPNDKLRAFSGISGFLERPLHAPFFFGLPSSLFDIALLWKSDGPCERGLTSQPSWSWTGWNGCARYYLYFLLEHSGECTVSQVDIRTHHTKFLLCSNIEAEVDFPSNSYDAETWQRRVERARRPAAYYLKDPSFNYLWLPRPCVIEGYDAARLVSEPSKLLHIRGRTAVFKVTQRYFPEASIDADCLNPYLVVLDEKGRQAGSLMIDNPVVLRLQGRSQKFLALSRSTYLFHGEDPTWDDESARFRHWSRQPSNLDECGKNEDTWETYFDRQHYDARVWWPTMNVMLLSEPKDGVYERIAVGQIHVTAFEPLAIEEEIILG